MADEDVKRALMEALGMGQRPRSRPPGLGSSGRSISNADKRRIMQETGNISNADRARVERMMGRIPPVGKGVGGDMDPSPEEEEALKMILQMRRMKNQDAERKAFPPASMMNGGGVAVAKKRKKSKKGCVMKGRGGSYKGMK